MSTHELEKLEFQIAKLLRFGVLIAGAFMLVGWLTQIQLSGNPFIEFQGYHASSLIQNVQQMLHDSQWGLLTSYFGLVVLISLPCLRVFMTTILFLRQKDFLMAGITAFVFCILLFSFTQGIEL